MTDSTSFRWSFRGAGHTEHLTPRNLPQIFRAHRVAQRKRREFNHSREAWCPGRESNPTTESREIGKVGESTQRIIETQDNFVAKLYKYKNDKETKGWMVVSERFYYWISETDIENSGVGLSSFATKHKRPILASKIPEDVLRFFFQMSFDWKP